MCLIDEKRIALGALKRIEHIKEKWCIGQRVPNNEYLAAQTATIARRAFENGDYKRATTTAANALALANFGHRYTKPSELCEHIALMKRKMKLYEEEFNRTRFGL